MIDRVAVNRALAKAIAYKQCGKDQKAAAWAAQLVRLLDAAEILDCEDEHSAWRREGLVMQLNGEMA